MVIMLTPQLKAAVLRTFWIFAAIVVTTIFGTVALLMALTGRALLPGDINETLRLTVETVAGVPWWVWLGLLAIFGWLLTRSTVKAFDTLDDHKQLMEKMAELDASFQRHTNHIETLVAKEQESAESFRRRAEPHLRVMTDLLMVKTVVLPEARRRLAKWEDIEEKILAGVAPANISAEAYKIRFNWLEKGHVVNLQKDSFDNLVDQLWGPLNPPEEVKETRDCQGAAPMYLNSLSVARHRKWYYQTAIELAEKAGSDIDPNRLQWIWPRLLSDIGPETQP